MFDVNFIIVHIKYVHINNFHINNVHFIRYLNVFPHLCLPHLLHVESDVGAEIYFLHTLAYCHPGGLLSGRWIAFCDHKNAFSDSCHSLSYKWVDRWIGMDISGWYRAAYTKA